MKIAVTGASGFVGRNFVKALLQTNHHIVSLVHRGKPEYPGFDNISSREIDIHNSESINNALKDVDIVFHLVGIITETKSQTFKNTVITGTKNIVTACQKNGVKKIIYLSALGTSEKGVTKYYQSKWAAEETVRYSGINYIILRPSAIFGEDDKFVNMLVDMIKRSPIIPVIGNGLYMMQPIYVEDLTNIMVQCLNNEKALNQTIEIGGPEQLSFRAIIALLRKMINKKRANVYIPIWMAKMGAFILEIFMKPSPVTRDQIKMLVAGNICSCNELQRIFNVELTTLKDGINKYLR